MKRICAVFLLWSGLLFAANPTATVNVDANQDHHAISPLVYGSNLADESTLSAFNIPLHRLGGNRMSRYNWAQNVDATGVFYYFESYPDVNVPGGIADSFIQAAKNAGAEPMMTVPMLDWICKTNGSRDVLPSFSVAKYGAQCDTDPFLPDAGDGLKPDCTTFVTGNNPADAGTANTATTQSLFVQHLIDTWGTTANGGLKYYILDNEYSDWNGVHRDVHPTGANYEEIRDKMISFGEMIRAKEPNATIVGPEEVGWYSFFYSGLDQQSFNNNGTTPDYTGHGDTFYMDWLLDQLHQHDLANPTKRVLDVYSSHWYPSGNEFSNDTTSATELLRNRSTRAWWDPNYTDENGLFDPIANATAKPDFIHRMQNEVNTYYPGLKTAITEYSWGAVNDMNGATAQADALGILGREGVDIATAWFDETLNPPGMDQSQPAAKAFEVYRNYDGANSTFGDTNVRATVANPDNVSSFAATRSSDGALTVVVINKYLTQTADVTVNLANFQDAGSAKVYQLATNVLSHLADRPIAASSFAISLPPKSITMFEIAPQNLTPDFSISCTPSTVSAVQGTSGTSSCTLTSQQGFNNTVTLSCTGLPGLAGPCAFDNNPLTPTASSGLTVPTDVALAPADYPFQVSATDGTITHTFNLTLHVTAPITCIFCDDFEDGNLTSPLWTLKSGSWSVSSGNATVTTLKKAEMISPAFGGCIPCTFETNASIQATGRISLYAWYNGSDYVEIRLMQDKQKLYVKQRKSKVVSKMIVSLPITGGTFYNVKAVYDGAHILVSIDGVLKVTLNPVGAPNGTAKYRVKSPKGTPITALIKDISVY